MSAFNKKSNLLLVVVVILVLMYYHYPKTQQPLIYDAPSIQPLSENQRQILVHLFKNSTPKSCFQSPFVICKNFSILSKQMPAKLPNISVIPTQPVVVTSLLNSNYFLSDVEYNFADCPYPCVFKPRENISQAKGVMVDGVSVEEHHFPETRLANQIYILLGLEPPFNYVGSLLAKGKSKFNDQINLIKTYRLDSDLPELYSRLCLNDRPRKTTSELEQLYHQKTRMAVWFVSNCDTPSKRSQYVKELQKYIQVDIFGGCGKRMFKTFGSERQLFTTTYKFYLAFENGLCKDYVTEKFFKLFSDDAYIIPVVRGGADYNRYLPPGTFINTEDFESPRKLAEFLRIVAADSNIYTRFLQNRDVYTIEPWAYKQRERLCDICKVLHFGGPSITKRYPDIKKWLTHDVCYKPKDI